MNGIQEVVGSIPISSTKLLALMAIIIWPMIPLFWVPVHFGHRFFRGIGLLTYLLPIVTWLPIAYLIYQNRDFLLQYRIEFVIVLNMAGILLLAMGTLLHIWTGLLLGLWGLIGLPEIGARKEMRLMAEGPFAVVRHPTYLAHLLMFSGVFLITGVIASGIVAILDLIAAIALIIPLEERELSARFGKEYELYKKRVPRFFPLHKRLD